MYFKNEYFSIKDLDYVATNPGEIKDKNYDLAVDCSGSGPAMEAAVPHLKRGGRLCVFGVANPKATLTLSPFEVIFYINFH